MMALETGRICIKTTGREAGKKAVILKLEKGFALIDGPHLKRRKCNIRHLVPTSQTIALTAHATHEEVSSKLSQVK
ncbi:MAG: 50S ribosomal protein L14e [Candidatus Diapherotrites archaeon]|nr:50S ribosomal protein L14e [Candidatus Diapherotrites archaeon]